ncbi:MAG TPA: hypothetical protein VNY05_32290 [Candidatus Acidoferrales bacterium]|nr:hypothetical protein [Candidatus Acidoferrales bacterium]
MARTGKLFRDAQTQADDLLLSGADADGARFRGVGVQLGAASGAG